MNIRSTRTKTAAGLAALAMLAFPLAACGSEDDDAPAKVSAVASLDDLSNGKTTQITLDSGFLEALDTLGLTPGTIEGAKLDGAKLSFPITGGNVHAVRAGHRPELRGGPAPARELGPVARGR